MKYLIFAAMVIAGVWFIGHDLATLGGSILGGIGVLAYIDTTKKEEKNVNTL